jgi:hypothetical protein
VRRVGHHEIDRTAGGQIAQSMERALAGFVTGGQMPASGTGGVVVVPVVSHQDRRWDVLDVNNALWSGLIRIHPVRPCGSLLSKRSGLVGEKTSLALSRAISESALQCQFFARFLDSSI